MNRLQVFFQQKHGGTMSLTWPAEGEVKEFGNTAGRADLVRAVPPAGWAATVTDLLITFRRFLPVPRGAFCTHRRMRCPNGKRGCGNPRCGHLYCPDCGLSWDDEIPPVY